MAKAKKVPVTRRTSKKGKEQSIVSKVLPTQVSLSTRDLFKFSPLEMIRNFADELQRAYEKVGFLPDITGRKEETWAPVIEVMEQGGKFIVRTELPGVTKEHVKVEMTDNSVIIQGERKSEHEENEKGYYRSERSYGHFYRSVLLPEGALFDQAEAKFQDGVLEVSLPLQEGKPVRRQLPIKDGSEKKALAAAQ